MTQPPLTAYVSLLSTLVEQFAQHAPNARQGRPCTYTEKALIVLFVLMPFHRISHCKAPRRWLEAQPAVCAQLNWTDVPHRTTLSRRDKYLYPTVQHVGAFVGHAVRDLGAAFTSTKLGEDTSVFTAHGPVWHQRDCASDHVPAHLRTLDRAAAWSKSGDQGWVYGSGLHLTCTDAAFPKLVPVEPGSCSASQLIDQQMPCIREHRQPQTRTADDRSTKATRIRAAATHGVALLPPALRWRTSRCAQPYHRCLKQPRTARCFRRRRTTIEPVFDLVAQVRGPSGQQKHRMLQRLPNVRMCLRLATLPVQIAMIVNPLGGLPPRTISTMIAACP
jgi:hypothetical protein